MVFVGIIDLIVFGYINGCFFKVRVFFSFFVGMNGVVLIISCIVIVVRGWRKVSLIIVILIEKGYEMFNIVIWFLFFFCVMGIR